MTHERTLTIRCLDCPKSETVTWLPLTWRATCNECAQASVTKHLESFPRHRVSVSGSCPEESKDTQRLLGKTGW